MAKPLASSSANVFRPTEREKNSLGRFTYQLVYRPDADARTAAVLTHSDTDQANKTKHFSLADLAITERGRRENSAERAEFPKFNPEIGAAPGRRRATLVAGRIRVVSTTAGAVVAGC